MIFAAVCNVLNGYVVADVWWGEVDMCDANVYSVCSRSDIVFNQSAGAITDHSHSAKEEYPYITSQLCGGPGPPKADTHFTERAE